MTSKRGVIKAPKQIAGVKLPKSVRKGSLAAFINTPIGQAVIANAVLSARDALAENPDGLSETTLKFAFSEAGKVFADAIRGEPLKEPEAPDADWPADFDVEVAVAAIPPTPH
jgi:hypothetical protein